MRRSSIKKKTGLCPDCKDNKVRYLIGGRCQMHYKRFRSSLREVGSRARAFYAQGPRRRDLIETCDEIFSKIIRYTGSIDGENQCFTCKCRLPIKELDCGHYISRRILSTRWERDNARPQCRECNRLKGGKQKKFRIHLCRQIGEGKVLQIESLSRSILRLDTAELLELKKKLMLELKNLLITLRIRY